MSADAEVWYPHAQDLGIDEGTRARLARLLIDESIALPPSRFGWEKRSEWDHAAMLAYGQWLCGIVGLDPKYSQPPSERLFDRASRLGIGPSRIMIYRNESIGNITEYQRQLGFTPYSALKDWTKAQYVREGIKLAHKQQRRPDARMLNALGAKQRFPGYNAVIVRFGTLTNFHEYIGMPSVRGWEEDDYIEWGVAFMRQNSGRAPDAPAVQSLSRRKVGPSLRTIYTKFDTMRLFRDRVAERYEEQLHKRVQHETDRHQGIRRHIADKTLPVQLFEYTPLESHLKIYALYEIAQTLQIPLVPSEVIKIARMRDADAAVRRIANSDVNRTVADVEMLAEELNLYDDIWPSVRFENVNLKLA